MPKVATWAGMTFDCSGRRPAKINMKGIEAAQLGSGLPDTANASRPGGEPSHTEMSFALCIQKIVGPSSLSGDVTIMEPELTGPEP